ncbi:circadian clock-controlled protein daywake-like isoform X2 [Pectinophora gossypiella]|nr:circadian clock-controlled protein daywake-like isoform X2 [Pectinophora gossypiella]XP_049872277.1 circadian clock-controlled protein daywake-like isoform X2 [Pectinophora gossypiella]
MKWDLQKNVGQTRIFGNLTFLCDYETDGRILLVPITGKGKLTVKMYNTDMLIKFKIKTFKDADGVEHLETYDFRPTQQYGNVKIHMSNILGGNALGDTINQVLNENWRDLMAEVGPPFIKAVANKVHDIVNKLYSGVPYDELMLP